MGKAHRKKPLLIYDGDCSFCRLWIERWRTWTGERVDYVPYQEVTSNFPHIPVERFKKSVQLIMADGSVFDGAHAVFRTLDQAAGKRWMVWLYEHVPAFAPVTEWVYRFVASHRNSFSKLTHFLWGDNLQPSTYNVTRGLFLRGIGVIYLVAFVSLSTQVLGLVGSNGILPGEHFLNSIEEQLGNEAYRLLPTLAWFDASDAVLQLLCYAGIVLSLVLVFGLLPRPASILLWVLYLSLFTIGQDFLSFQWDILLLEAGFLAIFFAPLQLRIGLPRERPASKTVLWLARLLLFRLVFQSGVVKLTSGDPTWRNLTALTYHYETQCIPTPVAWYIHQLPEWFQKISVTTMFFFELAVPLLIFAPRRLRFLGAWLLMAFQFLIILTGNYTFFNWLTIVLCITLLDDALVSRLFSKPKPFIGTTEGTAMRRTTLRVRRLAFVGFATVMIILNLIHLGGLFVEFNAMPGPALTLVRWTMPYHIVNSYGLFRVMTTTRPEIIVEGSDDGQHWFPYEFKYKPGDEKRPPPWVAPHQPRLDWQMWFAALSAARSNPWFVNLMVRLLQGSPEVLALLEYNPFPEKPPRYVHALLYDYHFTESEERNSTGAYWRREYKGVHLQAISLRRN